MPSYGDRPTTNCNGRIPHSPYLLSTSMRRVDLHSNSGCNAACTTRHSADAGDLAWHAQARADQVSSSRTHVSEPRNRPRHQKACCFECLSWPPCCTISVHRPMLCTSYLHIGLRFPSRCVCVCVIRLAPDMESGMQRPCSSSKPRAFTQGSMPSMRPPERPASQAPNGTRPPGLGGTRFGKGGAPERWVLGGKGCVDFGGASPKTTENHVSIPGDRAFTD